MNTSVSTNGASITGSGRASATVRTVASCVAVSPVVNAVMPAICDGSTPDGGIREPRDRIGGCNRERLARHRGDAIVNTAA